jgi:hypothetical protein
MSTSTGQHALRVAGAIALPFIVGEILGWEMPFMASIFALQLVAMRQPPLALRAAIAAVIGIAAAFVAAVVLTAITARHPPIFILAVGLALYGALYAQARKGGAFWFFLLVAICATPLLARQSDGLAVSFVRAAVLAMLVAVLTAWLMHAAFPDPAQAGPPPAPPTMEPQPAARAALVGTLVVMPLLLYLLGNESSAVVVTVTALTLLKASSVQESTRTASGLVAANVLAGGIAVAAYAALMIAPTLAMLVAVMLAVSFFFAGRIALGGQSAALAGAACAAAVLLIGAGLTPFTDAATVFGARLVNVLLASAYTVGAYMVLEELLPEHDTLRRTSG